MRLSLSRPGFDSRLRKFLIFIMFIFLTIFLTYNFSINYTSIGPGKTLCKGVANYKQEDFTFYV